MLKPNGLFVFSCASTGRLEHGTRRTSPHDSYGTIAKIEDMQDYYKNLNHNHICEIFDLNDKFSSWDMYYNSYSKDLYFLGIKKSNISSNILFEEYKNEHTKKITFELGNVVSLSEFKCCWTEKLLTDPVVLGGGEGGHEIFEKNTLEEWLINNDTSPVSGIKLSHKTLTPHYALKNEIDELSN
jgi:hypothetical protein